MISADIPLAVKSSNILLRAGRKSKEKAAWIKEHDRETEWITNKAGHSWYNGYYDNHGKAVEGDNASGVRMMLTSQVFPIMSRYQPRNR